MTYCNNDYQASSAINNHENERQDDANNATALPARSVFDNVSSSPPPAGTTLTPILRAHYATSANPLLQQQQQSWRDDDDEHQSPLDTTAVIDAALRIIRGDNDYDDIFSLSSYPKRRRLGNSGAFLRQ